MKSLEVIGEGALYLGGDGQGLSDLEKDPVAMEQRPPPTGSGFDASHLNRYDGTDFVQWYGRRSDGRFYPWGKIMRILELEP